MEKALRQVAESKARAQDEAAEWKRKYEMERLRVASLEQEPEQCQSPYGMSTILYPSELIFLSFELGNGLCICEESN